MPVNLPDALIEYFAAANSDDAARVAACFTSDAIVHDERRDIRGRPAIRAWAEETRRKYRYHVEATAAEATADQTIVTAHLAGDFPGSPIDVNYRFTLADSKIARLEIG